MKVFKPWNELVEKTGLLCGRLVNGVLKDTVLLSLQTFFSVIRPAGFAS